jgi:hypothetical protein
MQKELDCLIQVGVTQLTRLLINSETRVSSGVGDAMDRENNVKTKKPTILPLIRKFRTVIYFSSLNTFFFK